METIINFFYPNAPRVLPVWRPSRDELMTILSKQVSSIEGIKYIGSYCEMMKFTTTMDLTELLPPLQKLYGDALRVRDVGSRRICSFRLRTDDDILILEFRGDAIKAYHLQQGAVMVISSSESTNSIQHDDEPTHSL